MTGRQHTVYVVERYWPGVTADRVRDAMARLASVPERDGARHLGSVLVPADECVLSLFVAASLAAVVAFNRDAGVPFDRVVAGMLVGEPQA